MHLPCACNFLSANGPCCAAILLEQCSTALVTEAMKEAQGLCTNERTQGCASPFDNISCVHLRTGLSVMGCP